MKFLNKIIKIISTPKQYIKYLQKLGVKIGKDCYIDKTAFFGSEPWLISIGNNTRIARNCCFVTHDGGLWTLRNLNIIKKESVKYGNIKIGNNCNISWNTIIMPNVVIGNNCIIAAGAVVTKNVPDNTIWGGVPAKQIETIDEYYKKIKNDLAPTNLMNEKEKINYLKANNPELFL